MLRTTLLASALAVLFAGAAPFAFAQSSPATPAQATTSATASTTTAHPMLPMHRHADNHRNRMARGHGGEHQRGGVISDLRSLERLYLQAGRSQQLTALYNDVLARSQDPRVRSYVYHRMARQQAQPANFDQAIATLRKGLDENLANEAKRRSARETMRTKWQQRSGTVPAAATPAG